MRILALCLILALSCIPPIIVLPNDASKCPAACQHLRELGCSEGADLPDGTTCEKFCSDTQKNGHDLHPECIASITTCSDLARCSR